MRRPASRLAGRLKPDVRCSAGLAPVRPLCWTIARRYSGSMRRRRSAASVQTVMPVTKPQSALFMLM